jgi:cytochrome b-561
MAPKSRSSSETRAVFPITMFAHLLFVAVLTLVLVWLLHFREGLSFTSDNKQKLFNLHPFFMVIGFLLIVGQGIMVYNTIPADRQRQKATHMTLNLTALLAGIVGLYAVFKFHHDLGIPNMYSLHSWLGMSTICLSILQFLFGFSAFMLPRGDKSNRGRYAPWHILFGLVIFFLAIITAMAGLTERFFFLNLRRSQEALVVNFTGLLIFLYGVSVLFTVLHRYW